jgi:DNA-nicking Smr family endonuclease
MRDAVPLPGRAVALPPPEPASSPPPPAAAAPVAPVAAPRRALPDLDPWAAPGIDRRTDTRLRQGRMAIEGRIDLHGMTQDAAHAALAGFLHRGWSEGRRCVLVITGKGRGGEGGGVLRRALPRWLNDPGLRPLVVAANPAHARDGGDGAFYVLIRRRRDK